MSTIQRSFGKPAPLHIMMERGEEFFDAVNQTDPGEILERSRRISRIALTAATIAGEKTQHAGDGISKQLVYAAYIGIQDIADRVITDTSPDEAEALLTSNTTHQTLLLASKSLKSYAFDTMTKHFNQRGEGFELADDGLILQPGLEFSAKQTGRGCPYAMGNPKKAAYFNQCTDTIVKTYTQAYRQGMPKNLASQIFRR